jgi:pimeloyl-ACP methyl ester carboxylesterase
VNRSRLTAYVLAAALAATGCHTGKATRGDRVPLGSATAPSSGPATPSASGPSATPGGGTNAGDVPPAVVAASVAKFATRKLAWTGCGDGFQCADLTVPLDYAKPDGDTIAVAVIRLKARKQSQRIGSVVLNPGGPGGSGVEFARSATQLLPGEILDRFDTVSFDPRGVGKSAPVECLGDADLDRLLAADPTPDNATERSALFSLNKGLATACQRKSAKLLPHLGTVDAARDMEVLRAVLGDPKLTYVGFSYGTILGARYAQQFPTHIRAFVLDGAVDPSLSNRDVTLAQAQGFETALTAFIADCDASGCPLSQHGRPTKDVVNAIVTRADAHPYSASRYPGRRAGESEVLFGIAAGLYSKEFYWPVLRQGIETAYSQNDASGLLTLFDSLVERDDSGHFSNSVEAQAAISCVDGEYAHDPAAYDRDAVEFAKKAPRFGRALAYGPVACAYWSVPPVSHPAPVSAPGAPTIVVVGTTRDPATPYAWSKALATQLKGVLLTHDGDGHTAYGYHRSACVERVVDAYLLALTVPSPGTRCS